MQLKRCPELAEGKMPGAQQAAGMDEPDTPYRRKLRMTPVVSMSNHGRLLSRRFMKKIP